VIISVLGSICEIVGAKRFPPGDQPYRVAQVRLQTKYGSMNFGEIDEIILHPWMPSLESNITDVRIHRPRGRKQLVIFMPVDHAELMRGPSPELEEYLFVKCSHALDLLYAEQQEQLKKGEKR